MSWRIFPVLSACLAALVINVVLLIREDVKPPDGVTEISNSERKDPLKTIAFTAASRSKNFEAFGLPKDLLEATEQQAARYAELDQKLGQILDQDKDKVARAFCPGKLHPRYAALEFLVEEEHQQRVVIDGERMIHLQTGEWVDLGTMQLVYETLELAPERKTDATLMGVSAILLHREDDVLSGTPPFGGGMLGTGWSFDRLREKNPEIVPRVVQYFALMHVLAEIANAENGICGG